MNPTRSGTFCKSILMLFASRPLVLGLVERDQLRVAHLVDECGLEQAGLEDGVIVLGAGDMPLVEIHELVRDHAELRSIV